MGVSHFVYCEMCQTHTWREETNYGREECPNCRDVRLMDTLDITYCDCCKEWSYGHCACGEDGNLHEVPKDEVYASCRG
jgi:hypothetical protein